MHIPKPSPKRLCVNAHNIHQTRNEVLSLSRSLCVYEELHKTLISSPQQRIIIHKAYLDDLCRLAFNLMGYGGGLVHLGTPTQTVLLSKWVTTAEERRESELPLLYSAWVDQCFRSLFGVPVKHATASDSYCMCLAQRSPVSRCTIDRWWWITRGDHRLLWMGWPEDSDTVCMAASVQKMSTHQILQMYGALTELHSIINALQHIDMKQICQICRCI